MSVIYFRMKLLVIFRLKLMKRNVCFTNSFTEIFKDKRLLASKSLSAYKHITRITGNHQLQGASYLFTKRVYNVTTTRHRINIFCTPAFTLKDLNTNETCFIAEFNGNRKNQNELKKRRGSIVVLVGAYIICRGLMPNHPKSVTNIGIITA